MTLSEEDSKMLATPAGHSERLGQMLRVRRPSIRDNFELCRSSPIPGLSRGGARIKVRVWLFMTYKLLTDLLTGGAMAPRTIEKTILNHFWRIKWNEEYLIQVKWLRVALSDQLISYLIFVTCYRPPLLFITNIDRPNIDRPMACLLLVEIYTLILWLVCAILSELITAKRAYNSIGYIIILLHARIINIL